VRTGAVLGADGFREMCQRKDSPPHQCSENKTQKLKV
jgi:hypothetical protein